MALTATRAGNDEATAVEGAMLLADGRRLAWRETGDPAGLALLALHGTPGSRIKFDIAGRPARALGLRIIAPDRWGYGNTSPHPSPTLEAFVEDMAALADHLGLARLAVLGVSGGGPYATAVATLLAERIAALALVAPVGPLAGEGVVMSRFHAFCFGPFARSAWAPAGTFGMFRAMLRASPRLGMTVAMARAGGPDRRVLASGVSERLGRTFIEGMKHGPAGPATDLRIFSQRWQLPLERATMPTRLWLGDRDRHVPLEAARLLARRLPRCDVVDLTGEGHLWIALNYDKVLGWTAEAARRTGDAARA